jgi:multiple sugar transport system permease protein
VNERRTQSLIAWAFLLPGLAGLCLFYLLPFISIVYLSLTDWNLFQSPRWMGLTNFLALARSWEFRQALAQTVLAVLFSVPLSLIGGLALALLVNRHLPGARFFRAVYFTPAILYTVAISVAGDLILRLTAEMLTGWGGLGAALARAVMSRHLIVSLILITVYKWIGFDLVIFLGGLRQIPYELLDAARVDGAGSWALFRHITLPLLSPALLFAGVMNTILTATAFDQGYALGGSRSASLIVVYIFDQIFEGYGVPKGGYAAAAGLLLAVVLMGATALQLWLMRRWVLASSEGVAQ